MSLIGLIERTIIGIEFPAVLDRVTASVEVLRSNHHYAPEGMMFRVIGADPRRFDYVWDFGDPGAVFEVPDRIQDRDANKAIGPVAAHSFPPGTFEIRLRISDRETDNIVGFWKYEATVKDPEDLPPLVVQGDFDEAAAAYALQGGRLVLPEGYVSSFRGGALRNFSHPVAHISGPGKLEFEGGIGFQTAGIGLDQDVILSGFEMQGGWNAQTERFSRESGSAVFTPNGGAEDVGYIHIHGMKISGMGVGAYLTDSDLSFVSHTKIDGHQEYSVFNSPSPQAHTAMIGCRFWQDPLALPGGNRAQPVRNQQGPTRAQNTNVVIDACDMFSTNGWFPNVLPYRTTQPCIRQKAEFATISRTVMEGGFSIASVDIGDTCLMQDNYFVGNHNTVEFAGIHGDGKITLRGNKCYDATTDLWWGEYGRKDFQAQNVDILFEDNLIAHTGRISISEGNRSVLYDQTEGLDAEPLFEPLEIGYRTRTEMTSVDIGTVQPGETFEVEIQNAEYELGGYFELITFGPWLRADDPVDGVLTFTNTTGQTLTGPHRVMAEHLSENAWIVPDTATPKHIICSYEPL